MKFLDVLYGSQYIESKSDGKNGDQGRLNGNIYLTVLVIMALLIFFLSSSYFTSVLNNEVKNIKESLGHYNRIIGKIMILVLGFLANFLISKTIGKKENFKLYVNDYLAQPEEVRLKAKRMLYIPPIVGLVIVCLLLFLK